MWAVRKPIIASVQLRRTSTSLSRSSKLAGNMWRREDSDHSISDEDYDYDWAENRVSSADVTSRKEGGVLGIASKLELLTGRRDTDLEKKATNLENVGFFSEDEVEIPEFNHEAQLKGSKDAENNYLGSACVASCKESVMQMDKSSLVYASTNASPKTYRQSKGCNQNFDGGFCISKNPLLLDRITKAEYISTEATYINALGCSDGEIMREPELALQAEEDSQHDYSKLSIAELLDNLQEKNGGSKEIPKISRPRRKGKRHVNQNNSNLGKKVPEEEDPCELPMNDESSEDDEGFRKCLAFRINEPDKETNSKGKTMADQFQEVICVSNLNDDAGLVSSLNKARRCSGGLLLGRLQKVIQWEKERDLAFVKSVQPDPSQKLRCIDAKILSRSFAGKLTVCRCSIDETRKGSPWTEDAHQEKLCREGIIIFNSKVCGDIELEVGTSLCIYHPWKEVRILGATEIVVLASYFSHVRA